MYVFIYLFVFYCIVFVYHICFSIFVICVSRLLYAYCFYVWSSINMYTYTADI